MEEYHTLISSFERRLFSDMNSASLLPELTLIQLYISFKSWMSLFQSLQTMIHSISLNISIDEMVIEHYQGLVDNCFLQKLMESMDIFSSISIPSLIETRVLAEQAAVSTHSSAQLNLTLELPFSGAGELILRLYRNAFLSCLSANLESFSHLVEDGEIFLYFIPFIGYILLRHIR